jgi:hypothetical protein
LLTATCSSSLPPFRAVGLARSTGELDLWYSDHGIDTRFALKHHSPFTAIYGREASQLTRLESETILGAEHFVPADQERFAPGTGQQPHQPACAFPLEQ